MKFNGLGIIFPIPTKSYFVNIFYKFFKVVTSIFEKPTYMLNMHVDWSSNRWTWTSYTFSSLSLFSFSSKLSNFLLHIHQTIIIITPAFHGNCTQNASLYPYLLSWHIIFQQPFLAFYPKYQSPLLTLVDVSLTVQVHPGTVAPWSLFLMTADNSTLLPASQALNPNAFFHS